MKGLFYILFFSGLFFQNPLVDATSSIESQVQTLSVVMSRFLTGPLREDVNPQLFARRNTTAIIERQVMELRAQVAHEMEWSLGTQVEIVPLRKSISSEAMKRVVQELRERQFQALSVDGKIIVSWDLNT
jgi:hypothetical protein